MSDKSIKGTRTEENLLKAFAGESQARNRYTYSSSVARKEGLMQISALFAETADQEKEHAKRFFSYLEGGAAEITATYPAGMGQNTAENLLHAAEGEHEEHSSLYPGFAKVAQEEGFGEVAALFRNVSVAEKRHEARYRKLLANLEKGEVFSRPVKMRWACRNCGYIHEGEKAPDLCPACLHPQAYFELEAVNY